MSKKIKAILFIIVVLAIFGFIVGWFIINKPHSDIQSAEAIEAKATDLCNSFLKDTAEANKKYTNKVVQVTGAVLKVDTNQQKQQVVLINTYYPNVEINCTMEENENDISTGDIVIIKGICNGYNGDPDMGIPGDIILTRGYPVFNKAK